MTIERTDQNQQGGQGPGSKPQQDPSGVPNEGREYRGGRQGQGGVPNPDDADDRDSAVSFRGTADDEEEEGRNPE